VLRTITKKLTRRQRVFRSIDEEDSLPPTPQTTSARSVLPDLPGLRGRRPVGNRGVEWTSAGAQEGGSGTSQHGGVDVDSSHKLEKRKSEGRLHRAFTQAKRRLAKGSSNNAALPASSSSSTAVSSVAGSREDLHENTSPHLQVDELPETVAISDQKDASCVPEIIETATSTSKTSSSAPTKRHHQPRHRLRRSSMTSMHSVMTRTHVETTSSASAGPSSSSHPPRGDEEPMRPRGASCNFPQGHLVGNLQRFGRYSSAAYGQQMMRILGIGRVKYNFPATAHHENHHAFAFHTGLVRRCICLSGVY
jgi:hypothetical protein